MKKTNIFNHIGSKPSRDAQIVHEMDWFGADRLLLASRAQFDPKQRPIDIGETTRTIEEISITESKRQTALQHKSVVLLGLNHLRGQAE